MKKTLITIFLLSAIIISTYADDSLNLLKNANFAKMTELGIPVDWKVYGKPEFKQESGALKITVKEATENISLTQKITGLPENTKLLLTGKIKGTKENLGYLQIKLKRDKKELERKQTAFSNLEERELKLGFSTMDSNNVTVIIRFSQETQAVDDNIWIKDLQLIPLK